MASIVMQDYGEAVLDDETLAIVEYVEKLTKEPSEMTENDIQTLRKTGLSDNQILSVVMITSMFAFMNRIGAVEPIIAAILTAKTIPVPTTIPSSGVDFSRSLSDTIR